MFLGPLSRAASIEVGPFGGWRFGGTFDDARATSYTTEASGSWGGVMDIFFGSGSAVELLFSRQNTSLPVNASVPTPINLTLNQYQIGGLKEYREDKFRPFLAGLVGWTHVKGGNKSDDFFSATLGGGAKYYLTSWLGVRGDLRCYLMFTNGSIAASSGPSGGSVSYSGDVFAQGEVAGSVFLAFGGPRALPEEQRPLEEFRRRQTVPQ